jgi:hypothetical protein
VQERASATARPAARPAAGIGAPPAAPSPCDLALKTLLARLPGASVAALGVPRPLGPELQLMSAPAQLGADAFAAIKTLQRCGLVGPGSAAAEFVGGSSSGGAPVRIVRAAPLR